MATRKALGNDPFDIVTAPPAPSRAPRTRKAPPPGSRPKAAEVEPAPETPPADSGDGGAKVRFTSYLRPVLATRLRNAVAACAGAPEYLTVSELLEQALTARVEELETTHNGGHPFPSPGRPLRVGRPAGRG
jgi:hypothetical protein